QTASPPEPRRIAEVAVVKNSNMAPWKGFGEKRAATASVWIMSVFRSGTIASSGRCCDETPLFRAKKAKTVGQARPSTQNAVIRCGRKPALLARRRRQRNRIVRQRVQVVDDVGPLRVVRDTGKTHCGARHEFLRIGQEGVEVFIAPLAALRLHAGRV